MGPRYPGMPPLCPTTLPCPAPEASPRPLGSGRGVSSQVEVGLCSLPSAPQGAPSLQPWVQRASLSAITPFKGGRKAAARTHGQVPPRAPRPVGEETGGGLGGPLFLRPWQLHTSASCGQDLPSEPAPSGQDPRRPPALGGPLGWEARNVQTLSWMPHLGL